MTTEQISEEERLRRLYEVAGIPQPVTPTPVPTSNEEQRLAELYRIAGIPQPVTPAPPTPTTLPPAILPAEAVEPRPATERQLAPVAERFAGAERGELRRAPDLRSRIGGVAADVGRFVGRTALEQADPRPEIKRVLQGLDLLDQYVAEPVAATFTAPERIPISPFATTGLRTEQIPGIGDDFRTAFRENIPLEERVLTKVVTDPLNLLPGVGFTRVPRAVPQVLRGLGRAGAGAGEALRPAIAVPPRGGGPAAAASLTPQVGPPQPRGIPAAPAAPEEQIARLPEALPETSPTLAARTESLTELERAESAYDEALTLKESILQPLTGPAPAANLRRASAVRGLRSARVALNLAEKDATDAARAAGVSPPPSFTEGNHKPFIEWFSSFLDDPERIQDWDITLAQRREVRGQRARGFSETLNSLIEEGFSSEDAIRLARSELAGKLPAVTTGIERTVTPAIREALFDEVRLFHADNTFELNSTATALTNALAGKPIPRTPGVTGRSAFSRLQLVFGDKIAEAITKQQTLNEVLTRRGGRSAGPPGPFREQPSTQEALQEPVRQLLSEKPPGPFQDLPSDVRTSAERDLTLRDFKTVQGVPPDPPSLEIQSIRPRGPLGTEEAARQASFLSPETLDRMIDWARRRGLDLMDFMNLLRANVASIDLSWMRQQKMLIFGHLPEFREGFEASLRGLWSGDYAKQLDAMIRNTNDPLYNHYLLNAERKSGRDFLRVLDDPVAKAWERAEEFIVLAGDRPLQRLARKMIWLKISNRSFVSGINAMNWAIYKNHHKLLLRKADAISAGRVTLKPGKSFDINQELDVFASYLADMSGRGPLGPLKEASPALNAMLFSVRLNIGRLISPRHLASRNGRVRREAWKDFFLSTSTMAGFILGGREMGLWDVETDPRSSDFMKPIIGGRRIDVWAGYQQYLVLYGRILSATTGRAVKSVETGKISPATPEGLIGQFTRTKVSPGLGAVLTAWFQKDFKGADIDRKDWRRWLKESLPIAIQDVLEGLESEGISSLPITIPAGITGEGTFVRPITKSDISREARGIEYDDIPTDTPEGIAFRKWVREEQKRRLSPRELKAVEDREAELERNRQKRSEERKKKFPSETLPSQSPESRIPAQSGISADVSFRPEERPPSGLRSAPPPSNLLGAAMIFLEEPDWRMNDTRRDVIERFIATLGPFQSLPQEERRIVIQMREKITRFDEQERLPEGFPLAQGREPFREGTTEASLRQPEELRSGEPPDSPLIPPPYGDPSRGISKVLRDTWNNSFTQQTRGEFQNAVLETMRTNPLFKSKVEIFMQGFGDDATMETFYWTLPATWDVLEQYRLGRVPSPPPAIDPFRTRPDIPQPPFDELPTTRTEPPRTLNVSDTGIGENERYLRGIASLPQEIRRFYPNLGGRPLPSERFTNPRSADPRKLPARPPLGELVPFGLFTDPL